MSKIEYDGIRILGVGDLEQIEQYIPKGLNHSIFHAEFNPSGIESTVAAPHIVVIYQDSSWKKDFSEFLEAMVLKFTDIEIFVLGLDENESDEIRKKGKQIAWISASENVDGIQRQMFPKYFQTDETVLDKSEMEPKLGAGVESLECPESIVLNVANKLLIFGSRHDAVGYIPIDFQNEAVYTQLTTDFPEFNGIPRSILMIQPIEDERRIDWPSLISGIKKKFENIETFFLCQNSQQLDESDVKDWGIDFIFHPKLDHSEMKKKLFLETGGQQSYHPVSLFDILPDVEMQMNLYVHMPLAKKYIKFAKKGVRLDQQRYQRLQSKFVDTLYVRSDEIEEFYKYCAEHFKSIESESGLSVTERRQKLSVAAKKLFSFVFLNWNGSSEIEPQKLLEGVIEEFLKEKGLAKTKRKVREIFQGQGDLFEIAASVSSLAVVFSMVSAVGAAADVATAGLLMDTGFVKLPTSLATRDASELSFDALDLFKTHPELSLEVISEKKIKISDSVAKLIKEHHESFNGKGFPKSLKGTQISAEAALLTLADIVTTKLRCGRRVDPKILFDDLITEFTKEELVEISFVEKFRSLFDPDCESKDKDSEEDVA